MAKITIDLSKGIFEVEGSEEFVEKHFTEFRPQLINALNVPKEKAKTDLITPALEKTSKKPPLKRSKKVDTPDIFKTLDELPLKLKNGVVYAKLKSPQNRMLWVLSLASELGLDGLINNDIVWVTDKLGAGVPRTQITAGYQRLRNKGFVNQSTLTSKMRITEEGAEQIIKLLSDQDTNPNG